MDVTWAVGRRLPFRLARTPQQSRHLLGARSRSRRISRGPATRTLEFSLAAALRAARRTRPTLATLTALAAFTALATLARTRLLLLATLLACALSGRRRHERPAPTSLVLLARTRTAVLDAAPTDTRFDHARRRER